MWSIYAVAGLVLLAVALYKLWQRSSSPQYARIVPSDDYDDLPDLIDTSPPPRHRAHRLPSRPSDSEWQSMDAASGATQLIATCCALRAGRAMVVDGATAAPRGARRPSQEHVMQT